MGMPDSPSNPWDKRQWLGAKPFRIGTYVQTSDTATVEILAHAGFDYVIIDGEHSPLSSETIKQLIVTCSGAGIVPLVRVRENSGPVVMAPLDMGAYGIQIPQIANADAAEKAVRYATYHPLGERGANPYVRATGYSTQRFPDYVRRANANTLIILQIEGVEGVANVEPILATQGVDIVWLGPYDLSQSMGRPGEVEHPEVLKKMEEVVAKARAKRIGVGTFADNEEAARRWIDLGVGFVGISYETKMLFDRAAAIVNALRSS